MSSGLVVQRMGIGSMIVCLVLVGMSGQEL